MPTKGTKETYGGIAIGFHWLSALLVLCMLPFGFLMQNAGDDSKLLLYRLHVAIGFVILLLTLARLVWKIFDVKPNPPIGLKGLHLRGAELIHVLIYLVLFVLSISGIVLMVQSGFVDVLRGSSQELPNFSEHRPRMAHGLMARVLIGLLIAHVGGVIVHQYRHGNSFHRMGIGNPPSG